MIEQILLSSGSFDRVREMGGFGQPLHTLYPQIQAVLANELGPDAAHFLAEPVVDRAHDRIDWYTEGDPECKPIVLSDLPEEQRPPILAQVQAQLQRGQELAERYTTSGDPQRMQLGAMLKAALGSSPTETDIFLLGDRPMLAHWGFTTDRPWEMGGTGRRSPRPPLPAETFQAVAMPDIAIPELASSAAPPPISEPRKPSEEPMLEPDDEPPPSLLKSNPSPAAPQSDEPRYIATHSRYFWGLAVLAILLALGIFLWVSNQTPTPPLIDESAQAVPDVPPDAAMKQAGQTEQMLRASTLPTVAALGNDRVIAAESTSRDEAQTAPETSLSETDVKPPVSMKEVVTALKPNSVSDQEPVTTPVPSNPEARSGVATLLPNNANRPLDGSRAPASAASLPPAPVASPVRTLEEELQGSRPAVSAVGVTGTPLSVPMPQPSVELAQSDPTPEERQEFTNRLSATGAATGEITATLLWNGNADLDLVVLCPSGEMMDYQNPRECGGALDVDANTARDSLSNRPVENAFWPAGRATPGVYRIIVRYAPRKDEQQPRPTPFQVRLIRNNQEKVFKGIAQPRKATPVTNFIVER
ncbi:MAG: hypothetical protein KDJ22_03810 [Candidatus Competibacteraceae bacterium]|nr:hypothetical protein [Candidatus Competibacteraceae bacterium]